MIFLTVYINLIFISRTFAAEELTKNFIPSIKELKENLEDHYEKELKIEKQQYLIEKPTFWDLFSGIKLNCKRDLLNDKMTFSIGYNFMKLFSISRASKKYKFQIKKLEFKNRNQYQKHLESLIIMVEELKKKAFTYNETCRIHKFKEKLFEIDQAKYKEGEITPSEFLKKKIIFEFDKSRLHEMKNEIFIFRKKILCKSKNINLYPITNN